MAGKSTHQTIGSGLVDVVKRLYPEALSRTYIVPPVHFNRVPYDRVTVPGTGQPALQLREAPHDADRKAASKNQPGVQTSASGQNQPGVQSSASVKISQESNHLHPVKISQGSNHPQP
ncbi:hypothetical protein V1264_007844 [Littorina saxatilis]|uniref:Uncharacterized protein n=1 Tax=Littorina saxatilis TaxID=31220 RepID=A0AAN9G469_9CAEN